MRRCKGVGDGGSSWYILLIKKIVLINFYRYIVDKKNFITNIRFILFWNIACRLTETMNDSSIVWGMKVSLLEHQDNNYFYALQSVMPDYLSQVAWIFSKLFPFFDRAFCNRRLIDVISVETKCFSPVLRILIFPVITKVKGVRCLKWIHLSKSFSIKANSL